MKTSDCVRWDDPQAPFGPDLLCPRCEGLAVAKYHPALLSVLTLFAMAIGGAIGTLLPRL